MLRATARYRRPFHLRPRDLAPSHPRARSGRRPRRARCGYRRAPAPAHASPRNPWQSRTLPARRDAFWQAPLQALPPASAYRRLRFQNGATRMLRWISVSTSASIRPSCANPTGQRLLAFGADAADLKIGAAGQIDQAVAAVSARSAIPAACPAESLPPCGRTRTTRPSPDCIGRSALGHQPLISKRFMTLPARCRDRVAPGRPQRPRALRTSARSPPVPPGFRAQ